MNAEATIAPCGPGAWHGGSPACLRACVTVAGELWGAACMRVAGILDGADAWFDVVAQVDGRGDAPVSAESAGASASTGQVLLAKNVGTGAPLHIHDRASDMREGDTHEVPA